LALKQMLCSRLTFCISGIEGSLWSCSGRLSSKSDPTGRCARRRREIQFAHHRAAPLGGGRIIPDNRRNRAGGCTGASRNIFPCCRCMHQRKSNKWLSVKPFIRPICSKSIKRRIQEPESQAMGTTKGAYQTSRCSVPHQMPIQGLRRSSR